MRRPTADDLRVMREDRVAALLVTGTVALICWLTWAFSPRPHDLVAGLEGTVRAIGAPVGEGAYLAGTPQAVLDVETADGRVHRLDSDARLVANCRIGGRIHLERRRTNVGSTWYALAPRPCDS